MRYKSPHRIVEEVRRNIRDYSIRNYNFLADTFTLDEEYVLSLCESILQEGIRINWFANARVGTVTDKMAKMMKRSGCRLLSVGIESFDDSDLERLNKRTGKEEVSATLTILLRNDIRTLGFFILGLPGQTMERIRSTVAKAIESPLDFAIFNLAVPFPGTELYSEIKSVDSQLRVNWDDYHFEACTFSVEGIPDEVLLEVRKQAERRFYFKPLRLLRLLSYSIRSGTVLDGIAIGRRLLLP